MGALGTEQLYFSGSSGEIEGVLCRGLSLSCPYVPKRHMGQELHTTKLKEVVLSDRDIPFQNAAPNQGEMLSPTQAPTACNTRMTRVLHNGSLLYTADLCSDS